ncbi:hypothetical protein BKA70DRAFT_1279069 [Coprinopsis sp. MPI-PUGE-AT-0042]|nr:hypothetical protein BKA70DRAFT_1279069 [Coprinopsis sp. MPI-PUGE-AT-0042]
MQPTTTPPIQRLPTELISMLMCWSLGNSRGLLGKKDRYQFIVLRSVCRRWREVAFSTPELWHSLDVDISAWHDDSHENFYSQLTGWFARAGEGASLRLALWRTSSGPWTNEQIGASSIISLLNEHSYEYLSLGTTITTLLLDQDPPVIPITTQDTLHSLSLLLSNGPALRRPCEDLITEVFQSYPQLQSLALGLQYGTFVESHVILHACHHLRSLLLYRAVMSIDDFVNSLDVLPALEELLLWNIHPGHDPAAVARAIELPTLKRLLIYPNVPIELLNLLTCPSLSLIDISGYVQNPPAVMQVLAQSVVALIERSNLQYENFTLALGKYIFHLWTTAGTLCELPLLQHLQIVEVTTTVAIRSPSFGWPTSLRSMSFREKPASGVLLWWLRLLQPKLEGSEFEFTIYIPWDPVDGDSSAREARRLVNEWGMDLKLLPRETLDHMGFSDAVVMNHEYRNPDWR